MRPGGVFLFDVIDEKTIERINFSPTWEMFEKMFEPIGFSKVESIKNVVTGNGPYNDHGVVLYAVSY